ncbi:MAG: TauD/TfdA dioxygenase family protein [Rhodospirillales bacterium]|jgi:taurine dioxygenase
MQILPTGTALGAEARGIDIRLPLDTVTAQALTDAWHEHLILIFRGQALSNEEQISFTSNFGTPDHSGTNKFRKAYTGEKLGNLDGSTPPEIAVVSNVMVNGKSIGSLGDGEAKWHTDSSYVEVPTAASLLHAHEVPPTGGDTWFNNMYAAMETLPIHLRQAIEGKSIKHTAIFSPDGSLKKGFEDFKDFPNAPGFVHPAIRTHPDTRRQALFLGRRDGGYVMDMPVDESDDLLDDLWEHAIQERFIYRHQWHVGDLIMWDNRCCMHRRDSFDPSARRLMHRTQTAGTRPT